MNHPHGTAMSSSFFSLAVDQLLHGCTSPLEAVAVQTLSLHCLRFVTLTLIHPSLQVKRIGLIVVSELRQACALFEATRLDPVEKISAKEVKKVSTSRPT